MNSMEEQFVEEYFRDKGISIGRRDLIGSNIVSYKKGTPDFLLHLESGERIHLEVKLERYPYFSKEQVDFIKKAKDKYWVIIVSRIGSFIIFEIDNKLNLRIIDKDFFKYEGDSFYFNGNGISLLDTRKINKIKLNNHINKLKRLRLIRSKNK